MAETVPLVAELPPPERDAIGLTEAEARRRLAEFGPNTVAEETPRRWRIFLAKFWAPVSWMLEATIAIQLAIGAHVEAAMVGFLLLFNTALGFIQESRADAALAALKKRLAPTASVRRDGKWVRLPAAQLVPGDAVRLSLGALVPADARILSGSVMADQSMLTGESVPVETESGDVVYAGALIRRGEAQALVTATGTRTYFGRAAEFVRLARAASTEQRAIFGVTRSLALVNGAVAAMIVLYAAAISFPFGSVIRLALTALLASIPVALPATFTLSAALAALALSRRGVLLTRLSAAHEAAAIDLLCSDKTGTLTRNTLAVAEVAALPGFDRERVLGLAAAASSEDNQDAIDQTIRRAAASAASTDRIRVDRFVPFDPSTKMSQAFGVDRGGSALQVVKGALPAVAEVAETLPEAWRLAGDLAGRGHRVIAVAAGLPGALGLVGLIALSDPPRDDSAGLVSALRDHGVRTVMVTGDSAETAVAIARQVGVEGAVCPPEGLADKTSADRFGVFARVVPEEKYRLVKALQGQGHVVGMCGDGVNDAPALRQAQIGIAVSSATDVAKAAAGMILTEPGLAGIVFAVREGRIAFQRLLTFAFTMLVKKIEIVLFLAIGLLLTGQAVMTPVLMVLMLATNDFLSMSLTTDRASPSTSPSGWRMRDITAAAVILGVFKLGFSTAVLAYARFRLGLAGGALQTVAFVTIVFGNQALLYALRERRRLWSSRPGAWVLASSGVDIAVASALSVAGVLMTPLSWPIIADVLAACAAFAFLLDQAKRPVLSLFRIG